MANIQQYLDAIYAAVYGEDVRSSIHDAINIINLSSEKTLTIGTAVTSESSSISGYYENSLYLNINTCNLYRCNGSRWVLMGNIRGASISSITKTYNSGHVDTYTVNLDNGTSPSTFTVTNANNIVIGTRVTATNTHTTFDGLTFYKGDIYINSNTWTVWECTGSGWTNKGSIKSYAPRVTTSKTNGTTTITIVDEYGTNTATIVDGFDPKAKVTKSGSTTTIALTDIEGTTTETIEDGYSPSASIVKTGRVATITIVDKSGTTKETITEPFVPIANVEKVGDTATITIIDETGTYKQSVKDGFNPIANVTKTDSTTTISITDIVGTTTETIEDGYSPIANVVKTDSTSVITVTDKSGTTLATVEDGYSPTATVSKSGRVATITVTDKNGTTVETVEDAFVPVANVEKVDDTATITITDNEGTTTASVKDGFAPTVSGVKEGKVLTLTIRDIDGDHEYTVNDGNDGDGSGDMLRATYDPDEDGVVSWAENIIQANIDSAPVKNSKKTVSSGGVFDELDALKTLIGDLTDLDTPTKTTLVTAINESYNKLPKVATIEEIDAIVDDIFA